MILHYLDSSAIGGIETHVETLALAQCATGISAGILLHADRGEGLVRQRYLEAGLPAHLAGSLAGLVAVLRRLRPALLHTHGYRAGITGRPLARLLGIPVISTFHAGERGKGRVAFYQGLDEWTSFLGSRLAVSAEIARAIPFTATVMRNFVSLPAKARPLPAETCFAFAGRLSHEKGPDLFCDLAANNAARGAWHVHGTGPMQADLEARYPGIVRFNGFTRDMGKALEATTALVMTSRNEGLPMIALEAMARGVPVIAPATGGLPDLVEDGLNGFLYQTADARALQAALDRFLALTPNQIVEMGKNARARIAAGYSREAILPQLLACYREAGWNPAFSTSTNVQSSAG